MEIKPLKSIEQNPPFISQSIALIFIEFGLALSSIFVTPYFIRLGITSMVNALIWFVPYIAIFLVTGLRKRFLYKDRHKSRVRINLVLSLMTGLSLCGSLLFIFADSISEWYLQSHVATNKSARSYALILGIFGFVSMQSGLIISEDCITEIISESNKGDNDLELWVFRCKGIGRIAGFLLASLDIFEAYTLSLYYTVGDNLTFSYCFWVILHLLLLCLLLPIINTYDYNFRFNDDGCTFPSFVLVWNTPIRVKYLLLCYCFSYGSYILISIYATSWMTLSLFSGSPQGAKFIVHRRDFDLGISWGSFDMLILSIISLVFSALYSYPFQYEKFAWVLSNSLAGLCLSLCCYFNEDSYTFYLLPLCSFIFTTILLSPSRLSTEYDKRFTKVCALLDTPHLGSACKGPEEIFHIPPMYVTQWEKLMTWPAEVSKTIALCIVPIFYSIFPDFDDNRWAMRVSAAWGIFSGIFALLI